MLDIKSKLVLKILNKECPNGSYKIVDGGDIISAMPCRYKIDTEGLKHILNYLERQDCISIKYDEDDVYCVAVLPYGSEICENFNQRNKYNKKDLSFNMYFLIFIITFIACFLASFLVNLIKLH